MCGITGIISQFELNNIRQLLTKAQQVQLHRGPDSQGIYSNQVGDWRIGLGHQRLSILDLTEQASQPMFSSSQQSWNRS